jgi:dTDP-4-dehydrorhamnose 3,5-epimerase
MNQTKLSNIEGVKTLQAKCHSDNRGTFKKFARFTELSQSFSYTAVSINPELATIRGLHFQLEPYAEEKLVSCISGTIHDVIVDLRPDSATYGYWAAVELSSGNSTQLFIPKGVAHGYQTLTNDTIVQYILTSEYSSLNSYSIDPLGDIDISWPLTPGQIGVKDAAGLNFASASAIYHHSLKKN